MAGRTMPAAWTIPPAEPSAATVGSTAARIAAPSRTSISTTWVATPNRCLHSSAVRVAPTPSRSQIATGRPTSARARDVAAPIPDAPPVTTTPVDGVPSSSLMLALLFFRSTARAEVGDHLLTPLADRLHADVLRHGTHLDQTHDLVGTRVDQAFDVVDR